MIDILVRRFHKWVNRRDSLNYINSLKGYISYIHGEELEVTNRILGHALFYYNRKAYSKCLYYINEGVVKYKNEDIRILTFLDDIYDRYINTGA